MKTHTLRIRSSDGDIFKAVRDGSKTIETRAATPRFTKVQPGDVLRLTYKGEVIEKRVAKIERFASVEALLKCEDLPKIFPGSSAEEVRKTISGFKGYELKISKHGLLAFRLEDCVYIRPIQPKDADSVQALSKEYVEEWYGTQRQALYDWLMGSNHRTAWVAEIDGKVVGFAIISDKGDRAYVKLSSIAVAKGMRKRGVGERLLQTCLDYAMSTSHGRMILTVTEDNRLTKEFFVHHGFKLIGRIGNKYRPRKDEYVYERKLR